MSKPERILSSVRNAPHQHHPLIGRTEEIEQILDRLERPDCRLLTLYGPGGIGKTRLAVAAAEEAAKTLEDGVQFLPLEEVPPSEQLPRWMMEKLGLTTPSTGVGANNLSKQLKTRHELLVFDSFEAVLDRAARQLISQLLRETDQLVLLVTSRQLLQLKPEWAFRVEGLRTPPPDHPAPDKFPSVQLFLQRARQVDPGFSLGESADSIAELCRAVEGHPLALELAAGWVRSLTPKDIAERLHRNLDSFGFRHQLSAKDPKTLDGVFQLSWDRMSEDLRPIFLGLSIMRGPFDLTAAEEVAQASPAELEQLLDRSLIKSSLPDRFILHPLLKQFGLDRLGYEPELEEEFRRAHCHHFLGRIANHASQLLGDSQIPALEAIGKDLDDITAAWQFAIDMDEFELLSEALDPLMLYHQMTGRYMEASTLLHAVLESIPSKNKGRIAERLQAQSETELGWFLIRMGDLKKGEEWLQAAQDRYQALSADPPIGFGSDPRTGLAILRSVQGNYQQALKWSDKAVQSSKDRDDPPNLAAAHYARASAQLALGRLDEAQNSAQAAVEICRTMEDRWFLAYPLAQLGSIAQAEEDLPLAQGYYSDSLQLRDDFKDPEGIAVAKNNLGWVGLEKEEYDLALEEFEEAQKLYQDLDDRGGLARALHGQAAVLLERGNGARTIKLLERSLSMAQDIGYRPLMLSILTTASSLLFITGNQKLATANLNLIINHESSEPLTLLRAKRALKSKQLEFPEAIQTVDSLQKAVDSTLGHLRRTHKEKLERPTSSRQQQPLIEPLTEREIQILERIAEGHSNRQIAEELVLALGTVKWYTNQIYGKLQVKNRTEAAHRARELSLLH